MECTMTIIPPKMVMLKRLRVAAYCRVSTEREEQECSLKTQVAHYTQFISDNPDWDFAGIYAEQESGVGVAKRDELGRLLYDCEAGLIDIILIKSLSRLSRNTLDALKIFNYLAAKDIEIRFEVEGVSTKQKKVKQLLAMLAAYAQEESHSKSEDIKWGMHHQACQGIAVLNHTQFLGYTKDNDGNLTIVPEEAAIVKLIYSLYLAGYGYRQIKKHLESHGIKTVCGKDVWSTSTIDRILSNEKYVGVLVTQKTYVRDFLDGRQFNNTGELPQYVFEGHHEAIIESNMFKSVQEEKQRRSLRKDKFSTVVNI